jgi:hypothetical protein
VIVDLRTGAEREIGNKFGRFGGDWPYHWPQRFANLYDIRRNDLVYFDARTAVERDRPSDDEWLAARRARPVWRYPDGRFAWLRGGGLVISGQSGDIEEPRMKHGSSPCGLGLETWTPRGFYDFGRERFIPRRGLALRGETVWIRPGAWLTRKGAEFRLFDPDTDRFEPALGFVAKDEICAILDDGRVLVRRNGEGMLRIVPESGVTARVGMPRGLGDGTLLYQCRARTPGGRRIFMIYRDGRIETPPGPLRSACVRQDGEDFVATAALDGYAMFLGCPTDDEVIVHDGRSLWRLRFGSDQREEIWRAK